MKYCVFLKTKAGDFNSVRHMEPQNTTPFFDLVSSSSGAKGLILESKIKTFKDNIVKAWSAEDLFFIDHYDISLNARLPNGDHPYEKYDSLLESGYNVGLVTGIDRDDDYNKAVLKLVTSHPGTPLAVRVGLDEIGVPNLVFNEIEDLIDEFGGLTGDLYLILDCRVLLEDMDLPALAAAISLFSDIAIKSNIFHRIVVTSSSVPENLNKYVKTGSSKDMPRYEGELWGELKKTSIIQFLSYGDYATVSPDFLEIETTGPIPIFPKVIYTFSDRLWFQRGESTWQHKDGFSQYKELAKNVVDFKDYRSKAFSFGDGYIFDISQYIKNNKGKYKTGNATTWITASISQHVSFIHSWL